MSETHLKLVLMKKPHSGSWLVYCTKWIHFDFCIKGEHYLINQRHNKSMLQGLMLPTFLQKIQSLKDQQLFQKENIVTMTSFENCYFSYSLQITKSLFQCLVIIGYLIPDNTGIKNKITITINTKRYAIKAVIVQGACGQENNVKDSAHFLGDYRIKLISGNKVWLWVRHLNQVRPVSVQLWMNLSTFSSRC